MAITINNNSTRKQYTASSGETDFAGTWRIEDETDIKVYQALSGVAPDDTTDILVLTTDYTITGVGVGNSFTVVLNVGAATGDKITIVDEIDFSATYNFLTNQDFDPVVFNEIFSKFDRELKQLRMETRKLQPKYQNSEQVIAKDYKLPQLSANQVWKMNQTNTKIEPVDVTPTTVKIVYYGVTSGTDTYTVTIADFPGYSTDYSINLNIGTTSTGAATINVNSLGAKNLVRSDGTAIQADDLQADTTYVFLFHDNKYYLYGIQRATESSVGISQIATSAEVETGTNDFKYVTPKKLRLHTANVFFVNTAGAADVYTGTITGLTSLEVGLTVELLINTTNTGASTLNINGLGAKDLLRGDGDTLQADDLESSFYYMFIYNGAEFIQFKRPISENFVLQQARNIDGVYQALGAVAIPFDNTVPQNTEGAEIMTKAITPKLASSYLVVEVTVYVTSSNAEPIAVALFRDTDSDALATGFSNISAADEMVPITFKTVVTSSSTAATTFKVRTGGVAGNIHYNGGTAGALYNGTLGSNIVITEYSS